MFKVDPYDPFSYSNECSGKDIRSKDPTICRVQALLLPLLQKSADFDGLLFRHIGAVKDDSGNYALEGKVKTLKLVADGVLKDFIFSVS